MEDYIYRSFAKTLKRVANSDSTTLVSLVLYLLLNSAQKSEAVSRILLLPKTKQELLMIVLKGIESRLEHKVDFRYLIEKVEVVSDQNDGLREQLVHAQVEENKLVEQLAEL